MHEIRCRRCGKLLRFEAPKDLPYFPFCSERCKMIDLGKWFDEEHRISDPFPELLEGDEEPDAGQP